MATLGIPYSLPEIAQLAGARDLFQGIPDQTPLRYVAFDSRLIHHGPQTVFVALQTANRDGHQFIDHAWEQGVRNFIVTQPPTRKDLNYALVDDGRDTLQKWAMVHRQRFSIPVIGITGSNGKTIVKEWLATLLEARFQLVKSPLSYNSQLGVPLSVLMMHPEAEVALFEAGISEKGEMAILQAIIQPTIGIFTHFGAAHQEGFDSENQKLQEKLLLFEATQTVITHSNQPGVCGFLQEKFPQVKTIGSQESDYWKFAETPLSGENQAFRVQSPLGSLELKPLPTGAADKENTLLAIATANFLGLGQEGIQARLPLLRPLQMRAELITDNPDLTIINDAYTADPDSVRNALATLARIEAHPNKQVILSDLPHLGQAQEEVQRQLLQEAIALVGADSVRTVGPVFEKINTRLAFPDTDALLRTLRYDDFSGSTLLLKGARAFELERIIPLLQRKLNAAYFQVNLNALVENLRTLKARAPEGTRIMCMVKAASYGSGTWEIAQALQEEGVDYLTVAYASEGIALRQKGIRTPVMVMNPDPGSLETLIQFDLEPEIHSPDLLRRFAAAARWVGQPDARFHLKLETGMGRLGFRKEDLNELGSILHDHPDLRMMSVLSHLAAADVPEEDAFSHQQAALFQEMTDYLKNSPGLTPLRHLLNTAGLLRFPGYSFEMVRLGIGLYGIDPCPPDSYPEPVSLREIGSLRAPISQIQHYASGVSIGYGRSQVTTRETTIATVPVGYADGIPRAASNGNASFLVKGKKVPVFGRVCMDMLMLDITDIDGATTADEVVFFGEQAGEKLSVSDLATYTDTIAYEILVRISPRVRRIYVRD